MPRHLLAVSLSLVSLVASSCGPNSVRSLHSQRNLACLHALRDTDEGYQAAIDILQEVVKSKNVGFADWLNLARAQVLHTKRASDAAAALAKARATKSDAGGTAALDYVTGLFLKSSQSHKESFDAFERVLAVIPEHPEALYQSAYAAEKSLLYEQAKLHYQLLVDLKKLVRPASYRLSRVAIRLKDKVTEQAATKIFNAQDKNKKPEVKKCDLTTLDLRRFNRVTVEPKRVELDWSAVKKVATPELVRQVLPCPGLSSTEVDLFLVGEKTLLLSANGAEPKSTGVTLEGNAVGVVFDLDNKLGPEVVVADDRGFSALRRGPDGAWKKADVQFPAQVGGEAPTALAAFDVDHDGDVDIIVATAAKRGKLLILRNKGDGGFEWKTPFDADFEIKGRVARIDAHDLDQANDLDLLFPTGVGGVTALLNLRGEQYRPVALQELGDRDLLVVEDFNNDGAPDVFAAGGRSGWELLPNADSKGRSYQVRFLEAQKAADGEILALDAVGGDIDNDGDLDILLGSSVGLTVLRNSHGGTLTPDQTVQVKGGVRRVALADLGGDGVLDVVIIDGQGQVAILTPAMSSKHHAVLVAPEGRKDNRRAIGTVVNLYAERSFQSRMIKNAFGAHLGLGPRGLESLDGLRLRWPQGILQATPRDALKPLSSPLVFKQLVGLVASCPFLYGHGEHGWTFLTDVVGIAPLDEWLPPGSGPVALDPEEYVRIPGDKLVVEDGRVQLTITEELKETTYLDRAELYYVDHATDRDLLLDENIITQGKYDELKIRTIQESQYSPIARAMVRGENLADKISRLDRVYLHPYLESLSQWGGWTEPHTMELTTSAPASVLLMQGRIAWYDSSVAYALHQNGRVFTPMKMERIHPDGQVELMIEDVGIPTGMDRTIIVPLGDQPLPAGTQLRFTAQYRFLWDRIRTASQPSQDVPVVGCAKLAKAVLYHHGYSQYIGNPGDHEQSYDFDQAAPDDRYPRAEGMANEYGDVLPLLGEHDDQLVILVAGDAVKFEFAAPAVEDGMARTWFLKITGWAKEGSFHNYTGQRIAPLPFKAMSAYPPPAGESTPWKDAFDVLTRRIR